MLEIEKRVGRLWDHSPNHKNNNAYNNWIRNIVVIMERFGYTLDEMKQLPIPAYLSMCQVLAEESKQSSKSNIKNKKIDLLV